MADEENKLDVSDRILQMASNYKLSQVDGQESGRLWEERQKRNEQELEPVARNLNCDNF